MDMRMFSLLAVVSVLFSAHNGFAYYPQPYFSDQNAQYNTVTESYATPHIAWAKPYLDGRPRVLILAPRWGMRETVELMERMDMDAMVFAVDSKDALGANGVWEGFSYNSRIQKYETLLQEKWDAIILAGFGINILPAIPEISYLLNKVHDEGTGLLVMPEMRVGLIAAAITHHDPAIRDMILKPIPVDEIPALRNIGKEKLLYATPYGKGRIANIRLGGGNHGCFTADAGDPVDFEYCLALVIRTVQWVTGKEPLTEPSQVAWDTSFTSLSGGKLHFTVDPFSGKGMVPSISILRPGEQTLSAAVIQPDTTITGVNGLYTFSFPALPEGKYFFNIHLGTGAYRSTWYSGAFTVKSDAGIDSLVTGKECYARDGMVEGQVFLREGTPKGSMIELRLVDGYGRLMWRNSLSIKATDSVIKYNIPLKNILHNALTIYADLTVNGKLVSSKKREVFTPARGQNDFLFVMWDYGAPYKDRVTQLLSERLHDDFQIDVIDAGVQIDMMRAFMRANVRPLPYIDRYIYNNVDLTGTAPIRNPSLSDPQYRAAVHDNLRKGASVARDFSPIGYTLGDENNLDDAFSYLRGVDVDFHPASQDSFRVWLKGKYGTLEQVNAVWKTAFTSWADVSPVRQADALRSGQYARWIDHREFMEYSFAEMHRFGAESIRESDPGARVGFDGTNVQNSYHGYNFYQLFSQNGVQNIYDQPEQREFLRSFSKKDALTGIWLGSYWAYRSEAQQRRYPWMMLLHGMTSCWYWTMFGTTGSGDAMTALAPDLTPAFHFEWTLDEIREIKAGIGKLIMNCERENDGIAVHYSPASVHASSLDNTMSFTPFAQASFMTLLEDAGFQYDAVAVQQIEGGVLESGKYKVLVLPCSQVITPKEEKAIRAFVEKGGLLIADVRPGFYGNYGNPGDKGVLDDLFGIGRAPGGRMEPADLAVSGAIGSGPERFFLPKRALDGAINLTDGKALAVANGVPGIIVNHRGKGCAILFNFDLTDYWGTQPIPLVYPLPPQGALRERGDVEGLWTLVRSCMHVVGIEPRITVETGSGELKATETMLFSEGGARYLGVLRSHETENTDPRTAQIKLPAVYHIYNARTGAYCGYTDRVTETVYSERALLFSLLPYRVQGLTVKTPVKIARGAELPLSLALTTEGGKPGLHVFHIEVRDPQGNIKPCYSMNLTAHEGKAETKIPFALNDMAGQWTVTARDAATGCRAETVVTLY